MSDGNMDQLFNYNNPFIRLSNCIKGSIYYNNFASTEQMIKFLLIFTLLSPIITQISTPINKFGLLTVTHSRKGDNTIIKQYLRRYTETQCYTDLIEQINIVWNNEQSPEEAHIYERKSYWKIPVYFYQTTFNSMDHRYRLPKQSKSKIIYSLDDDIIVDCQTFQKTFALYNQQLGNTIKPIVANEVRGFAYHKSTKKPEFSYQGNKNMTHFSIAEPGAAFMDRHYLQLYYLLLPQITYLRQIVRTVNNCDDIFFFALTQHLYPEVHPIYNPTQKNYKNTDPKIGQSKIKSVYPLRDQCVNNISQILGYNPLRLFNKDQTQRNQLWHYSNLDNILQLRKQGIQQLNIVESEERTQKSQQKPHKIQASNDLDANILQDKKTETQIDRQQTSLQEQQTETQNSKNKLLIWIIIVVLALTVCVLVFYLTKTLHRYNSLKDSTSFTQSEHDSLHI